MDNGAGILDKANGLPSEHLLGKSLLRAQAPEINPSNNSHPSLLLDIDTNDISKTLAVKELYLWMQLNRHYLFEQISGIVQSNILDKLEVLDIFLTKFKGRLIQIQTCQYAMTTKAATLIIELGGNKNSMRLSVAIHCASLTELRYAKGSVASLMKTFTREGEEEVTARMTWVLKDGNETSSMIINEIMDIEVESLAYPYLKMPAEQLMKNFILSSERLLLLYGPPGCGKTSFIRSLIKEMGKQSKIGEDIPHVRVLFSSSKEIFDGDYLYAQFISGDHDALIMEDADDFVISRKKGNAWVHKLLNSADGIIRVSGKKIVISTNLESLASVDPALLRPGRCFGAINMRRLTGSEAKILTLSLGGSNLDAIQEDTSYSLAEIYRMAIAGNGELDVLTSNTASIGFSNAK